MQIVYDIFNWVIDNLVYLVSLLLAILPDSPFDAIKNGMESNVLLSSIGYLFPVAEYVAFLQIYAAAVLVWYGIRILARWVKVAEG